MFDDLTDLYQQLILDHSKSPRNFRVLPDANRTAQGTNPICGDNYSPRTLPDLKRQLRKAITSKELSVVDIPVDQGVNFELVQKLNRKHGTG
jgi:hypothetical protein